MKRLITIMTAVLLIVLSAGCNVKPVLKDDIYIFWSGDVHCGVNENLGYSGWSAFNESNNRFALLNDYMDGSMEAMRQLNYVYHRQGLDQLCDSTEKAHTALVESMELLDQARQARTMSNVPQLFSEYKKEELVNIFSKHENQQERLRVYDILFAINPSQNPSWEKIKK